MPAISRSDLLKFLSKPRSVEEVAEHCAISRKMAHFHLREAVESGQVLTSEKPLVQMADGSKGTLKEQNRLVYLFRKSPLLSDGRLMSTCRESDGSFSETKSADSSMKLLTKSYHKIEDDVKSGKSARSSLMKSTLTHSLGRPVKTHTQAPESGDRPSVLKTTDSKELDHLLRHRKQAAGEKAQSVSHVERIRFFQAVSKRPLSLLELHERFGINKQAIKRLVKNGLLAETWGSDGVGLSFRLTDKGAVFLRELERAAQCGPDIGKRAFVKLRNNVP